MIRRLACAAIAMCIASSSHGATVRFKSYMHPTDERMKVLDKVYLSGLVEAIDSVNILLMSDGVEPIFCPPPKLVITDELANEILTRKAQSMKDAGQTALTISRSRSCFCED
jgi:hypothetical protein